MHPGMTELDVFKLVMQAVFGGDHLLYDRKRFSVEFIKEWNAIPAGILDPGSVLQVIDPRGRTARIHLVPCKCMGLDPQEIVSFLLDQPMKNGESSGFTELWNLLLSNVSAWNIQLDTSVLRSMNAAESSMHHSVSYGFAAYRICNDITLPQNRQWFRDHGIPSKNQRFP